MSSPVAAVTPQQRFEWWSGPPGPGVPWIVKASFAVVVIGMCWLAVSIARSW